MNLKKNKQNIKKNYPVGIIGGGQLALMLVEAANNRGIKVCVQTKTSSDPAGSKADYVIEADPLKVKGNKELIKNCEKIIFENEWIKIEKLNLIGSENVFLPSLESIQPLVDRISQKKLIERMNLPLSRWISLKEFNSSLLLILLFPLPSYPPLYDLSIRGKCQSLISSASRLLNSFNEIHLDDGRFILSINSF